MAGLLAVAVPSSAQTPTSGMIAGIVRAGEADPVSNVHVVLTHEGTELRRETHTNLNGQYSFALVMPGRYELLVEKLGYGPKRVTEIVVRAGDQLRVETQLAEVASAAAARLEEERFPGAPPGVSPARMNAWLPVWTARGLPGYSGTVDRLARLAPSVAADLGVEGLPPTFTTFVLDGVPWRPASHALTRRAPFLGNGLPVGAAGDAQLLTSGVDVSMGGAGGGFLNIDPRRGTSAVTGAARATWSGDALPGQTFSSDGAFNDIQGYGMASGALFSENTRVVAGLQVRRQEVPLPAAWAASAAADGLVTEFPALQANLQPGAVAANAVAGHARVDWSGSMGEVGAWFQVAALSELPGSSELRRLRPQVSGDDLLGGATVRNSFGDRVANEGRIGITRSTRSALPDVSFPLTTIVGDGIEFGGVGATSDSEETTLLLQDALVISAGPHLVTAGAGVGIRRHRYDHLENGDLRSWFGGVGELGALRGQSVRHTTTAPVAAWTSTSPGAFVQDRWQIANSLQLSVGARVDYEGLPDVELDEEWQRLTGLSNADVDARALRVDLRGAFAWDVQSSGDFVVHAAAGMYHDRIDPLLLTQWQRDAGEARVRRETGSLTAWPREGTTATLRHLTMLAPGFDAPLSLRGQVGATRALTEHTSLTAAAVLRRTENLPRRTDLNLNTVPLARDQYGQGVYGTLVQHGRLIAAAPPLRRFNAYDEVAAVTGDGWSEHWGVSAGVEHDNGAGFGWLVRYTFSRTRDNWFAARAGGWTVPLPPGVDESWLEATSDFDIPHRAVAAVSAPGPYGLRLSLLYRGESGVPFTPMFINGVDANGDGVMGNEPAWLDRGLPGFAEAAGEFSCLSDVADALAPRNSCRGDAVHSLDASLEWRLLRSGSVSAGLLVEAFDILESVKGLPDPALLTVLPDALTRDTGARTVSLPINLNPAFGQQLDAAAGGRRLRVGLTVNW
jgi:hypothetical protein